jgi:hypothetical protein
MRFGTALVSGSIIAVVVFFIAVNALNWLFQMAGSTVVGVVLEPNYYHDDVFWNLIAFLNLVTSGFVALCAGAGIGLVSDKLT